LKVNCPAGKAELQVLHCEKSRSGIDREKIFVKFFVIIWNHEAFADAASKAAWRAKTTIPEAVTRF
jgi:hypothetical protein